LSVGGNQFSGTLPLELSNLRQLRDLNISWYSRVTDFRNRNLSGTIPVNYFRTVVPNSADGYVPTFPRLQNFMLSHTKITGSVLPPEIELATNLQVIRMGENRLMAKGSLPTELGLLTNLVVLDLAEVNLVSTIPTELGNLVLLKELKLENNDLTGLLPSQLSSLTSLSLFQVHGNVGLSGSIPNNICTLHELGSRGIGCPNDNVQDSGETSLCGCDCPPCL
jgi:Leucine-rich repeat (LRR) protein